MLSAVSCEDRCQQNKDTCKAHCATQPEADCAEDCDERFSHCTKGLVFFQFLFLTLVLCFGVFSAQHVRRRRNQQAQARAANAAWTISRASKRAKRKTEQTTITAQILARRKWPIATEVSVVFGCLCIVFFSARCLRWRCACCFVRRCSVVAPVAPVVPRADRSLFVCVAECRTADREL